MIAMVKFNVSNCQIARWIDVNEGLILLFVRDIVNVSLVVTAVIDHIM